MYGTQAKSFILQINFMFENDVNMYGTQAEPDEIVAVMKFENDVNMYGTQATKGFKPVSRCLRMM